ncbi:hypothetical protein VTK73DRAFT_7245 [Phialemonium thermophilum]|uniref:Large ribosomal subunit protein bL21m n=1 Tax=Phialemonium thermophilum TaxID=223376 RepID=A0ABR3XT21_9PEZI
MSRTLIRSALGLQAPLTRLPPTFLLPIRGRFFNQTTRIVEPTPLESTIALSQKDTTSNTSRSLSQSTAFLVDSTVETLSSPSATTATDSDPSVRTLLPLLAAQPGHYITVHIHGRPYLVTAGDQIRLPFKMPGVVPGDVLRLNRAVALGSRDFTLRGAPYVDERLFECRAVVLGTDAEPMRIMIKKKQRNRRKKHVRSKHKYTVLAISELRINTAEEMEN